MISITKTFEFSASHRLFRPDWSDTKNGEVFGKCANPNGHGHNYQLEVSVTGTIDALTGMVFDAALLDQLVRECVYHELDHKDLDRDVPWLSGKVTTVEQTAQAIWNRLEDPINRARPQARLYRVKLWETSRIYAVIEGA